MKTSLDLMKQCEMCVAQRMMLRQQILATANLYVERFASFQEIFILIPGLLN